MVTEEECSSERPLPDAIRELAKNYDCVIVGGGDGTLNAAAPALIETGLPLGILPLGTANDLARTLGIDPNPVAAAGLIVAGNLRPIDLGEVNGHPFFNVASIGFSAELAQELTAEAKRKWGVVGYAIAALRLLMRTTPFTAFIDHDGTTETIRTVQVSAGNGRHYGGGMTVESTAEPRRRPARRLQPRGQALVGAAGAVPGDAQRNPRRLEGGAHLPHHRLHGPHAPPAIHQHGRRADRRDARPFPHSAPGRARLRAARHCADATARRLIA